MAVNEPSTPSIVYLAKGLLKFCSASSADKVVNEVAYLPPLFNVTALILLVPYIFAGYKPLLISV